MADSTALIDENGRQSMTGRLSTDGLTITRVKGNPSNHAVRVDDNTTGSDHGGTSAAIDANGRQALFAESTDGSHELVALYVDSSGNLLVDSM